MTAYLLIDVGPVRDEAAYAAYRNLVPAGIRDAGGEYVVRGGAVQVLEGDWRPERVVVVRFASSEAARRWWSSNEYAELKRMRQASTDTRMVLVEGVQEKEA